MTIPFLNNRIRRSIIADSLQKELDLSFEDAEALKLGRKVGTVSEDAKQPILQQVTVPLDPCGENEFGPSRNVLLQILGV